MLVTIAGQIIRIRINGNDGDNIRITGRKTQGVRLFELAEDEKVVSVAIVREDESENPDEIEMTDITDDDTSNSGADDTPNAKIEQDATDENSETPE
jgi:DNA gyrase subunit A